MLEFNIRNQEISRIDNFSPAEKSVEYLIAKFNFKTDDWNEAIKRAIFRNVKSKVEKDALLKDDSCTVPWEVLVGSGDIEISVHGVIGTEEITTDVAVFNLSRTLQGGSATQEPSPTVYEQMLKEMQQTKEIAQSVRDDADNGKFSGIPGEKGDNGKSAYEYAQEGGFEGTEEEFTELIAQAGQVDLTGFITKEEHEAELLKTMVKVTTDKADFHHITDSANMKVVDFGMEGKTEQETTSGKNLFDIDDFKACETLSVLGSGANWGYKLNVVAGQTYTFNRNNSDGYNVEGLATSRIADGSGNMIAPLLNKWTEGENKASVSFTAADETYLAFNAGNTVSKIQELFDTYFINPQLELGSVATDYELFTNGPTPNPDFPKEIVNAGVYNEETGRYEHKCCVGNKNFWDAEYASDLNNWVNLGWYDCIPIRVPKGSKISISYSQSLPTGLSFYTSVSKDGFNSSYYWLYHSSNSNLINNKYTITAENDYIYICCASIKLSLDTFMQYIGNDLQIEIADAQTDFIQHQSQQLTLTSPVPLTKWDYLTKRDGVWGWSVWSDLDYVDIKESDITGNGLSTAEYYRIYVSAIKAYQGAECMCNIARFSSSQTNGCCGFWGDDAFCLMMHRNYIGYTETDTHVDIIQKFKDNVLSKGITVQYKTQTEKEFYPLPDEEQELLNNLETYYGVTNMYNDQGCPMWFTYVADPKLYVDQKLLEIQQAII